MPDATAMSSYAALCNVELWNNARLKAYVDNGLSLNGMSIRCGGCEGLEGILPCTSSEPPEGGYKTPESDGAPWYDPNVPESQDFAGFFVTDINVSAPYSRGTTPNIGNGSTLGRLHQLGRTITVKGWLIGRTCCSTSYGLRWLTAALAGDCSTGDCGGCNLDFLGCCPSLEVDDFCLFDGDGNPIERPDVPTEYQRGAEFLRRYRGVGVIDGPNILSRKGSSCGCSCGGILEIEFSLATSMAPMFTMETNLIDQASIGGPCDAEDECMITWCLGNDDCSNCHTCPTGTPCKDDPSCNVGKIPPTPVVQNVGCGCFPEATQQSAFTITSVREWFESTLNIEIFAGSGDMRNVRIDVMQNPADLPCSEFLGQGSECSSCASMLISYIPRGGTLRVSGEEREVTITCGNVTSNALGSVAGVSGGGFDWPDLSCSNMCVVVTTDCANLAADATISIGMVTREL